MHSARVAFICGREQMYVRNAMIVRSLERVFDTTVISSDTGRSLSFRLARVAFAMLRLPLLKPDLTVIGFYGHPLVPLARRLSRAPILFDPFVSTYDTLSLDRGQFASTSLFARFCFRLDQRALDEAAFVLSDTRAHGAFYHETFQVPAGKMATLYLGCDETMFYPRRVSDADEFTVFTYSTYMPLHGVDTIVAAAAQLQTLPIRFRIVGSHGPTYAAVRRDVAIHGLKNVDFVPSVPYHDLPDEIARAAVCLGGHFGTTPKARRVIAGKAYQFMAMGKPVILGDTQANRELFNHRQTAYMCEPGNPSALADSIRQLFHNPPLGQELARNGLQLFRERLNWNVLGSELLRIIESEFEL